MSGGSENVHLIGGTNRNYQDVVDTGHAQIESSYDALITPVRMQFGHDPNVPVQLENIPTSKVIIQNPLGNDPIYVGGLGANTPYFDKNYPGDYKGTIIYEGMSVPFPVKNANKLQVVGTPLQSFNYRCYPNVTTVVETSDVTPPNPDTNGPVVVFVEPEDGATGVALDEHIHLICNEPLLASSVNPTTVVLTPPLVGGDYEAYVYALDPSHIDLNHMPLMGEGMEHLLSPNTTYTVTLIQGGIKDLSENPIENEFSFSFTTLVLDTTPPTVTARDPVSGATGVQRDKTITITMSEDIDPLTVNNTTITMSPSISRNTFLDGADPTKIRIDPVADMAASTSHTVTLIAGGVKDLKGNAIAAQSAASFTTMATPPPTDTTPPTVIARTPAPSATNVVKATTIIIDFSEAMQVASLTVTSLELFLGATKITCTLALSNGNTRATLTPASSLEYSTVYTVFVRNTVKDAAGNSIAAQESWNFTTTAPLQITVRSPNPGDTNVNINSPITIDFDASLQVSTVTNNTIELFDTSTDPDTEITCTRTMGNTNTRVTMTPSAALKYSTLYQIFVRTGLIDGNGDNVGADISWTFTTQSLPLSQLYNIAGSGTWRPFGDNTEPGRGLQITSTNTSSADALYHDTPKNLTAKIRRVGSGSWASNDDTLYCRIRNSNGDLKGTIGTYVDARTITTSTAGASITFSNSGQNYVLQNGDCILVEYDDGDSSHSFEINNTGSSVTSHSEEVFLGSDGNIHPGSSTRDMGATINGLPA